MTDKTTKQAPKKGTISPKNNTLSGKTTASGTTVDVKNATKPPEKPQAKRSSKSNTKVATKTEQGLKASTEASEQFKQPTVAEMQVYQDNLTKQLMYSNSRLIESVATIDTLRAKVANLNKQSWWAITKERLSYTVKSWVFKV